MKLKTIKFDNVKSTNDKAIELIRKNQTDPSIIVAKKQIKGRGTRGKKWISIKNNLFISIFFEISSSKIGFDQFAFLNPYIVRKVLKKYTKNKIFIKWPNDLLLKKKNYLEYFKKL
jgi:BirA family transcriptional regulator, biotin operon repressor / biotin---[acetyl-CoA-carboxylase] ligase